MSKLFAISLILVFSISTIVAVEYPVPPALWCEDDSLARNVGVYDQCKAYNTSAIGKKVKITLLYEALCGGCQDFIQQVLYAKVWRRLKNLVDLELVPYGNARHTPGANGTYQIECQHGAEECKLNKLHSCVIDQLADPDRWFPYINCMEAAMSAGKDPDQAVKDCYVEQQIKATEQKKIRDCTSGPRGDQLQKEAADKTDQVKPIDHTFVPWILINEVSLETAQMYQDILSSAVCDWYRAEKAPPECQEFQENPNSHSKCWR